MNRIAAFCLASVLGLSGCTSMAPGPHPGGPHGAHAGPMGAAPADAGHHERQMQRMREMHEKMRAARTPEERAALMREHREAMQGGMAMMGPMHAGHGMGGHGTPAPDPAGLHRRMETMEMMMRMMMDREGVSPPATR